MSHTAFSIQQEETLDTRQQILDAAIEVFAEKGYHDTRIDDIVAAAGKSKGGVYFYFKSKQDIFLALIDSFAEVLAEGLLQAISSESNGIRRVNAALESVVENFGSYQRLAKIFLVQAVGLGDVFEQKRMEIHDRFTQVIAMQLGQAVAEGDLPPIDTEVAALAWMGSINEVVIRWVYTGTPEPERIITTLRVMLLRSIGVPEERIHSLELEAQNEEKVST